MARIRSVKPEFFKHEELAEAEFATKLPVRVAFAGLWTQADREGRFAWRPARLKTDVLPYDEVDFAHVLHALEQVGVIRRYEVDGKTYGYIPSFREHQVINHAEAKSKLPPPPDDADGAPPVITGGPQPSPEGTGDSLCGMGREGKGKGKERKERGAPDGATEGETLNEPSPSPEPEPEPEPPKRSRAEDVPVPPELDTAEFRETWPRWIASRRSHRFPMSAAFAREKLQAFTRYGPKASSGAMRESIEQGWQGVFPENFDLLTGAKRGKRNEPSRVGPGQRYAGAGGADSGASPGVENPRPEAGRGMPAGSPGRVVNGRWVAAG